MTNLDQLVRRYIIRSGSNDESKYARLLMIAIDGLREFNIDSGSGVIKTAILPIMANDTVLLPNDYIDYVKIGTCGRDGNIYSLGLNSKMCPPSQLQCTATDIQKIVNITETVKLPWEKVHQKYEDVNEKWEDFNPTEEVTTNINQAEKAYEFAYPVKPQLNDSKSGRFFPSYYADHLDSGRFIGAYFGVAGGDNRYGYYKVYDNQGYIALQNFYGSEIYLEYLGSIHDVDGNYMVHPYIEEALLSWIRWQVKEDSVNIPISEKQRLMNNYVMAKKKAKYRLNANNISEFIQAINIGVTSAPKGF